MVKASEIILIIVSDKNVNESTTDTYHSQQVALLFPPAAAAIITGCSCDLLINIILTMYVLVNTLECYSLPVIQYIVAIDADISQVIS